MRSVIDRKGKLEAEWERECMLARLEPHGRRVLRDICSGSLRWLDYYARLIDYAAPTSISDDLTMRLLASSTLYQSEIMERAPDRSDLRRAAADSCARLGKPHAANAVKEVCRRVLDMDVEERRRASTDASAYSLPPWLYEKFAKDRHTSRWLEACGHLLLERPDFLSLCVPPRAVFGGPAAYAKRVQRDAQLAAEPSPLAPHGVLIRTRPRDVGALPGVAANVVHVQDAAQQYACSQLRPLGDGDRLLDACAAPGGKSRALLFHHPRAHVTAVEANGKKVASMRAQLLSSAVAEADGGLGEWRRQQLRILHADVADVESWWDGVAFSAILLDPPCTASGLIRTKPEVKAHRSAEDVPVLRRMQYSMLKAVWPLLKEGGELLYTTCSILKDENDVVVATFLKRTPDAVAADVPMPKTVPQSSGGTALVARRRRNGAVLFLPSETHQGGFVARIKKGG